MKRRGNSNQTQSTKRTRGAPAAPARQFAPTAHRVRRPDGTDVCPQLAPYHFAQLERQGYTVVENVLSPQQCEALKAEWLATIESYGTGFKADDPWTWTSPLLPLNTRGMQNYPPVAHEPFVWEARMALAPVFAKLWDCASAEDLVTSFDRVCFVPPRGQKVNKRTAEGWFHLDQSHATLRGTLQCVQGFVTLNDIGEGEVALEVYAGSHHHHAAFFDWLARNAPAKEAAARRGNWCKLPIKDGEPPGDARKWYLAKPDVRHVRVHAPAGAVVLWDSRVVHHAQAPLDGTKRSNVPRFVIYVSMVPRTWVASAEALGKRREAFANQDATAHWPHMVSCFDRKPKGFRGRPLDYDKYAFDYGEQWERLAQRLSDKEMRLVQLLVDGNGNGAPAKSARLPRQFAADSLLGKLLRMPLVQWIHSPRKSAFTPPLARLHDHGSVSMDDGDEAQQCTTVARTLPSTPPSSPTLHCRKRTYAYAMSERADVVDDDDDADDLTTAALNVLRLNHPAKRQQVLHSGMFASE